MNEENNQADQAAQSEAPSWDQTIEEIVQELNATSPPAQEAHQPEPQAQGDEAGTTGPDTNQEQTASPEQESQASSEPEPSTEQGIATRLAEAAKAERRRIEEKKQWEEQQSKAIEDARKAIVDELIRNPQGFIQKYELKDLDVLGANFYAAALGDDTPAEIKQKIAGSSVESRLMQLEEQNKRLREELEQKLVMQQQQAEAKATLAKYQGYLSSVPEDLPYLKATDQEEALNAMAQVADHIWETENRIPDAGEIAQMLNSQIEKTVARYQSVTQPKVETTPPVPAQQQQTQSQLTLSNSLTNKRTTPEALSEDDRIEQAIRDLEAFSRAQE